MSDIRFIMIGVALIFVGFVILGVFGNNYQAATIESNEFGTCYEYSDDKAPIEIDYSAKIIDKKLFVGLIMGFVGAGIIALIKGFRGNWDNKVKL